MKRIYIFALAICINSYAWAQTLYNNDDASVDIETCDPALQVFIPKAILSHLVNDKFENVTVTVIESATGIVKAQYQAVPDRSYDTFRLYDEDVKTPEIPWTIHRTMLLLAILEKGKSPYEYAESFPLAWEQNRLMSDTDIVQHMTLDKAVECYDLTMFNAAMDAYQGDYAEAIVKIRHLLGPVLGFDGGDTTDEELYNLLARYGNSNIMETYFEVRRTKFHPALQTHWMSSVANNGVIMPLIISKSYESEILQKMECREKSLECLRMVLRESVTEGLAHMANSELLTICGLTDASLYAKTPFPELMERNYTFIGYNEPTEKTPSYTLCVSIARRGKSPAGVDEPCSIARDIFDWIAVNGVQ